MTKEEYLLEQQKMMILISTIEGMRLDEYIARMEKATAVGYLLDPTLYAKNDRSLDTELEFARGAREFKKTLWKIANRWKKIAQ